MNDGGILALSLLSPLSNFTDPENTSQYKLVKIQNTNRVNDLLIKKIIPVLLYDTLSISMIQRKSSNWKEIF